MNIAIDGSNFFHAGWLARLFGLPRDHPSLAIREADADSFREGWDTCDESRPLVELFDRMREMGQVVGYWQDDDGREIPVAATSGPRR